MKRAIIAIAVVLFIAGGEVIGSVYWIGGEVGPPGWGIEPASPNSSDVINFDGPTSQVFSNKCYAEMFCGGTPAIAVDPCGKTIQLGFIPPGPSVCSEVWMPVCGLGGTFGPLEVGHWEFFGNNPYATFSIEFDVEGATGGPVSYHVDVADGNDLNDGLSRETAFATIQRGIDAAVDGSTVLVWPGVYTGDGNRDLDFGGKAITVRSENGPSYCIIDCNGSPNEPHQGFTFQSGEGPNSILSGFTVTGGYSNDKYWQLINCEPNCTPRIINCLFRGNSSGVFGGGGGTVSPGPELINCTFYDNSGLEDVGIIVSYYTPHGDEAAITLNNCILVRNEPEEFSYKSCCKCGCGHINVNYSVLESGWKDTAWTWSHEIITADPCFADPCNADFHLQSAAGRWKPNSQSWVTDANTSVAIDAGDPNSDWTEELWPHGKRINAGAYGGTAESSMSLSSVGNIANLDDDVNDIVDGIDLGLFVERWCYEEPLLAENLDRNGLVNFVDFAIFAAECSGVADPETSISYQIEACDMGAKAAVESGEMRFSATVVGSYIHFEDMMAANCCPDELFLEMDVDGNVITIYEREFLVMPCFCICDYPVTATLGPFEAGVYTLEVYEDFGGFIGSTIVSIEP